MGDREKISLVKKCINQCDQNYKDERGCTACPAVALGANSPTACEFYAKTEVELDQFLQVFRAAELDNQTETPKLDNVNHPQHYELPNGIE